MSTKLPNTQREGLASPFSAEPSTANSRVQYRCRLASSAEDVRAAQLLRFMVFNLELQEGLEQSYHTCLDVDRFDKVCDHLLVEDMANGQVVGTYRLQTGSTAVRNEGYYSAQEFDLAPYEPLRNEIIELGRACVHQDHRNFTVLNLLWKGIANYALKHGGRYLIGCSSLTSQDPVVGAAAYRALEPHLAPEELRTTPLPQFACPMDSICVSPPKIPKLLSAYLMLGAKICGPPAIDREFRTIDFLTLLDLNSLPVHLAVRYFPSRISL